MVEEPSLLLVGKPHGSGAAKHVEGVGLGFRAKSAGVEKESMQKKTFLKDLLLLKSEF